MFDIMFIILLLFFKENKAWYVMWIICLADHLLKTSSIIFSEQEFRKWRHYMSMASNKMYNSNCKWK